MSKPMPGFGLCECGCGQPTKIARETNTQADVIRGMPRRFVQGHQTRYLVVAVGDRYGRGVVINAEVPVSRTHKGRTTTMRGARLLCDCGNVYVAALQGLVGKSTHRTLSCGCLAREQARALQLTHGMAHHPLYKTWLSMMQRCYRPNDISYPNYGGRGIAVCERWQDARLFIEDIERLLGPRPEGWSLDRENNDGNYEPDNIRWADPVTQTANRRPVDPEAERARIQKIRDTLARREPSTFVCKWCGREFPSRYVGIPQYCGKKCRRAAYEASGVCDEERTCHQCGVVYVTSRHSRKRHCGRSCGAVCGTSPRSCPAK